MALYKYAYYYYYYYYYYKLLRGQYSPNSPKPPMYENGGGVIRLRLSPYTAYYLACKRIYTVDGSITFND